MRNKGLLRDERLQQLSPVRRHVALYLLSRRSDMIIFPYYRKMRLRIIRWLNYLEEPLSEEEWEQVVTPGAKKAVEEGLDPISKKNTSWKTRGRKL